MKNVKNKQLNDFIKFCQKYPELKFRQAVGVWSGHNFILTSTHFNPKMFNVKFMPVRIDGPPRTQIWSVLALIRSYVRGFMAIYT